MKHSVAWIEWVDSEDIQENHWMCENEIPS
jgi:hypothetical protein